MEKIIIPVWSKKDDGGCEKNMRSKGWHDKENEECDRELLTELSFKLVCTNILGWCCRTSPMMPRWLQTWACGVYACVQARNRKARRTQLKMFQGQVKSCFEICTVVNPKIDQRRRPRKLSAWYSHCNYHACRCNCTSWRWLNTFKNSCKLKTWKK